MTPLVSTLSCLHLNNVPDNGPVVRKYVEVRIDAVQTFKICNRYCKDLIMNVELFVLKLVSTLTI